MSKYAETQEHTRMIIDFICDTRYEDIPEIVRERAKGRILDTIGVAYKAGAEPAGQIAKEYAKMYGGYRRRAVRCERKVQDRYIQRHVHKRNFDARL